MTEPVVASDLQQPGVAPKTPADTAPATQKITFHFGQGVQVPEGMKEGAVSSADVIREKTLDTFRGMGVPEEVLQQARARTPVSRREYELAQHKRASLLKDRGWVAKYLDNDQEARRTMGTLSIILGSNIKDDE
jgi:hypothetical protein